MIYGLYLSANGLVTQNMRADIITNNLANASTHGFKRDFLTLRQRDPEVIRQGGPTRQTQKHLLAIGGAVEGDRSYSIFEQGALQPTGNRLDLGLHGKGFFKMSSPDGSQYYTRNGAFTIDGEGFLVGENGFRVQSIDGGPIQAIGAEYDFDDEGTLIVDGDPAAQVQVVQLEDEAVLHKVGENLYTAQEAAIENPAVGVTLRPGFLESSSVSTVREMTALIQAHRAYEANARFIRIQDESLGKAVTQIAT